MYSSTICLPSLGRSSYENPYLHRPASVAGVKYLFLQFGANVFLMRFDEFVLAVWVDSEYVVLLMPLTSLYRTTAVNKMSWKNGI